jgi:hypothetical protein
MYRSRDQRRRWPRSRAGGCLLWVLLLIVILIILSVLFGGFQKGTKSSGPAPSTRFCTTTCTSAPAVAARGTPGGPNS